MRPVKCVREEAREENGTSTREMAESEECLLRVALAPTAVRAGSGRTITVGDGLETNDAKASSRHGEVKPSSPVGRASKDIRICSFSE